jgi:hypothetical protein
MDEQGIYRLVRTKEQAIAENLLLPGELQSLKEEIVGFLDERLTDESLLSMRYRKLKAELRSHTLWANGTGYPVDGPGFIRPWVDVLEQHLGDKAVKKRLEDKDLWVESKVQGGDEHLFIGSKHGSGEKVHLVIDGQTGEIRVDPKDQVPHDLLQRVEVILTTKDRKRILSTRGALVFLEEESAESKTRPTTDGMDELARARALALADLRGKYGRFLARLVAEWTSERDSDPEGIDEGKAIMARARQAVLDLRTELSAFPGNHDAIELLDQVAVEMASIQRHRLYIDANRSCKAFWDKGNEIIATLEQIRRVVGPSYLPPQ